MKILITGSAGFIGFHLAQKLCSEKKNKVFGIDNLSNYYDVDLKKKRNLILKNFKNYEFYKFDISSSRVGDLIKSKKIDIIFHLAAQAGIRFSVKNPKKYFDTNIKGFFNILEFSKKYKVKHLIFASSSSVYGDPKKLPMDEIKTTTDKPLSFYAATKKSNEVMAYSYSNIYKIPITCLRFFTVYGPWGRPDMFFYKILNAAKNKKKFPIYNYGNHLRDFTYIDDVVSMITKILNKASKDKIPYRLLNIGKGRPVKLKKIIKLVEDAYGKEIKKIFLPRQLGDVKLTYASSKKIKKFIKFTKFENLTSGINKYISWYKKFYNNES